LTSYFADLNFKGMQKISISKKSDLQTFSRLNNEWKEIVGNIIWGRIWLEWKWEFVVVIEWCSLSLSPSLSLYPSPSLPLSLSLPHLSLSFSHTLSLSLSLYYYLSLSLSLAITLPPSPSFLLSLSFFLVWREMSVNNVYFTFCLRWIERHLSAKRDRSQAVKIFRSRHKQTNKFFSQNEQVYCYISCLFNDVFCKDLLE